MGPSGSGKTTMLLCAAGLDRQSEGTVYVGDVVLDRLSERQRAKLRRERIGFVFQSFNLLDGLTAEQNVTLPARLAGKRLSRKRARDALAHVGLEDKAGRRPAELSGGEQQRVAVARAVALSPRVILADEPTGNLDPATAAEVHALLIDLNRDHRITMVIVTHNEGLSTLAHRTLRLQDGRLH